MAVTVSGQLVTGDGVAIPDVTILFKAVASSNLGGSEVIENTTFTTTTDELGEYSLTVNNGSYSITVTVGSVSTTLGTAIIDGDTPSPIDVLELVAYTGVSQTTAQDILDQAVAAKLAAEAAQTAAETAQGLAETAQAAAEAARESLPAISDSIISTAVDVFVYDTSKDTDGGAWRKRCQNTSWYNEALNTATRGSRRDFPAVAVIVAEANKVTIYDGDSADLPMWRVIDLTGLTLTTISAKNGILVIGTTTGLIVQNYVSDSLPVVVNYTTSTTPAIINNAVNDVAMTVLPDAPIDPTTGIQIPTIAVATDGGVSIIHNDGSVIDWTGGTWDTSSQVGFNDYNTMWAVFGTTTADQRKLYIFDIPYADVTNTSGVVYAVDGFGTPAVFPPITTDDFTVVKRLIDKYTVYSNDNKILALVDADRNNYASSLFANITSAYNTGWMNGDVKCCLLSDIDVTNLVATDTVLDRSINTANLTLTNSATVTKVATGSDLVGYNFASNETATLSSDISATGAIYWWEKVSGVWQLHMNDLSGGTDYVNGVSGTVSTNVSVSGTTLTMNLGVELSLIRASATIPTADQIAKIYNDEKFLFQENSACTLYGTSDAVTALAYDDNTSLLHAGTSDGRSVFNGLRRIDNTTAAVTTAISATDEFIMEQ